VQPEVSGLKTALLYPIETDDRVKVMRSAEGEKRGRKRGKREGVGLGRGRKTRVDLSFLFLRHDRRSNNNYGDSATTAQGI
jgi:hypothetical protein